MRISNAYFHRIIEYKDVKQAIYVKFNYDFWGKKIFDKLKADGIIETRSTPEKGFYLINKPPKGRKSAKFTDYQVARDLALKLSIEAIKEFPDNNFVGRTYLEDLSASSHIFINYLENCTVIQLEKEEITEKNIKSVQSKLKKLKSNKTLQIGEKFYSMIFLEAENVNYDEVSGLFELFIQKPFTVYNITTEINGEEVKSYVSDSSPM